MHRRDFVALTLLAVAPACAQKAFDPAAFKAPPAAYRGHAMWSFPLNTLNEKYVVDGIHEMAKLNYGGFFIEAGGIRPGGPAPLIPFLSPEYFRFYKLALEEAKRQGLEVILYDDYAFPTGTVGGQLSAAQREDKVRFRVPAGNWKAMVFYLPEGRARVVDYLDPTAMDTFISMTYAKYEESFGSYLGSLITQTFYDEPSMHHHDRLWTPHFNEAFQKKYGFSPMKYYPAL